MRSTSIGSQASLVPMLTAYCSVECQSRSAFTQLSVILPHFYQVYQLYLTKWITATAH